MKTAQPGTLIHGTLRGPDLIEAFTGELVRLGNPRGKDLAEGYALAVLDDNMGGAYVMIQEALDELENHAPAGHYFGAHEGDGSDFGFWPVTD